MLNARWKQAQTNVQEDIIMPMITLFYFQLTECAVKTLNCHLTELSNDSIVWKKNCQNVVVVSLLIQTEHWFDMYILRAAWLTSLS